MIVTEKIEVKINKMNIDHYVSLGYDVKLKDIVNINPNDLIHGSKLRIVVQCDVCNFKKEISFESYINNVKRGGFYSCEKCKYIKRKKTSLEKYGNENFTNRKKSIETNLEKYGVENVSQSEKIKEKKKETNLKNWGVEVVFQSEQLKEQFKKTKKEKYGDEYFTNREKSKATCFKNNGVEWPTQSKIVLETRNLNNKNKYNVTSYTQTEECQDKIKKLVLKSMVRNLI